MMKLLTAPLLAGRFGVDVFIVLSGFCLALPLARGNRDQLDSVAKFFARRCWRILPPYYAALLLSMLLVLLVPALSHRTGDHWDIVLPAFTMRAIFTHLLLIHNLAPDTAYRINHAFWSVATEFQIYLLFPILLLPIRRWFGIGWLVIASFAIGIGLHRIFPSIADARPWYLGLFALGMAAAEISFSKGSVSRVLQEHAWWLCMAVLPVAVLGSVGPVKNQAWILDAVMGMGSCLLVIACVNCKLTDMPHRAARILRLLESPRAMWVGAMSYSLYLIHPPILAMVNTAGQALKLNMAAQMLLVLVVGSLSALMAAELFYLGVEQWFIKSPVKPAVAAAVPKPVVRPMIVAAVPAIA